MIRHFFIEKTNSIFKGQQFNMGLNPILKLVYGNELSRGLLWFDTDIIKKYCDENIIDLSNIRMTLNMKNCMSIDEPLYEKTIISASRTSAKRASSFDLIFFYLPQEFDAGRGYDFISDFWIKNKKSVNTNPSNWYFSKNGVVWYCDRDKVDLNEDINWDTIIKDKNLIGGIYSSEFLNDEYSKFINNEDSKIFAIQHFDFGIEDMCVDVTKYFKKVLSGEIRNYGIGVAFSPVLEKKQCDETQYVGFFNDNTNTFFHPFIELDDSSIIDDNRGNFIEKTENKLYFISEIDDEIVDLDSDPTCFIEGKEYPVTHSGKGIYSVKTSISDAFIPNSIIYDKWSNLSYNGCAIEDVEMETVVNPKKIKKIIDISNQKTLIPYLRGINYDEEMSRDEVKRVFIDFRYKYEEEFISVYKPVYYRIYVKVGKSNNQYDIIKFNQVNTLFTEKYFDIYTEDLIPNTYFIDIKIGDKVFYECGRFIIKNNYTKYI